MTNKIYIIFFVSLLIVIGCNVTSQQDNRPACCNAIIRRQCISCHTVGKSNHSAGNVFLGDVFSLDSALRSNKLIKAKKSSTHTNLSPIFDSLLVCAYYVTDCNGR